MSDEKATIAVLRTGGLWRVLTRGETHRTYDYRVDAEEAALKLADRARDAGQEPEILTQDRFGEMRLLRIG